MNTQDFSDHQKMETMMSIMDADPAKYIRTPSGALVILIKIAEAVVASGWALKMAKCLSMLVVDRRSMMPLQILNILLPREIASLFMPEAVPLGGTVGNAISIAAVLAVLIMLICIIVEAAGSVFLFLLLIGSKVLKITHIAMRYASIVLTISSAASLGWMIFLYYTGKTHPDGIYRLIIISVIVTFVLALFASYHSGASAVLSSIEYEFRLGFKAAGINRINIGRDSLLLFLLFAVAAGIYGFRTTWTNVYFIALAVLAIKFVAVYSAWMDYRRCHS